MFVDTSSEQRVYYCGRLKYGERCPAPVNIRDAVVEPYVETIFWRQLERPLRSRTPRRLRQLEDGIARREKELTLYRDNARLPATIGSDRFADGLAVRARRVEEARVELARMGSPGVSPDLPPAAELRERWPSMGVAERRAMIAEVIEAVFVLPPRPRRDQRLYVCGRGFGPPNMPPRHVRGRVEARAFNPDSCAASLRLRRPEKEWSEDKIEAAVACFVEGRQRWPSFREFQEAGLVSLHRQIKRQFGHREMASRFGLPYGPSPDGAHAWTEEWTREQLKSYLAGKDEWPSRRQFIRDGRGGLRRAAVWFGGVERWADELGVPLSHHRAEQRPVTYGRLKRELERVAGGSREWPYRRDFREAGACWLEHAIRRQGVREQLARDLKLKTRQRRTRWTDEAIEAELDRLLEGRTSWPRWSEFRDAGLLNLEHALHYGGTRDKWMKRYGVSPPPPPPKPRWTDERIKADLDVLLDGRESWPRWSDFRDSGLANLRNMLDRTGTHAIWARRYGVEARVDPRRA